MYPQHCVVFGRAFYSDEKSLHSLTFETEEALSEERKKNQLSEDNRCCFTVHTLPISQFSCFKHCWGPFSL